MKITQLILLVILTLSLHDTHELFLGKRKRAIRKRYLKIKNLPRNELDTDDLELVIRMEK